METALFIRTWANPMTVRDAYGNKVTVPFNGKVLAEVAYLKQMPGFELYEVVSQETGVNIMTVDIDTNSAEDAYKDETDDTSNNVEEVEEKTEEINEIGLTKEDVEHFKNLSNHEWNKIKKVEIKEWLNKSNVDYSEVKDDRWELIKFFKKIIKEL